MSDRRKGKAKSDGARSARLTEADIVAAALRLPRRQGLNQLTMRGLADELGVTPMAAYYYVKNKHDLLMLAGDAVLRNVTVPPDGDNTWDERLRELYTAVHDEVSAYPGVGAVLSDLWRTEEGRRIVAATQEILLEAGFDERTTLLAHSTLHTYLFGRFSIEAYFKERQAKRAASGRVGRGKTTVLVRTRPFLNDLHGDDYLAFALDTLIAGLKVQLARGTVAQADSTGATPALT